MKSSKRPSYKLEEMKRLVEEGKINPTYRVTRFINMHYNERVEDVVRNVIESIDEHDFVKSVELKNRPGFMADIYVGGWYDETERYVKAFIEHDEITLQFWSMCWEGSLHQEAETNKAICPNCGTEMSLSTSPLMFRDWTGKVNPHAIEHNERPRCGEVTFSPEQLKQVDDLLKAS